jgi:hypothetical protein
MAVRHNYLWQVKSIHLPRGQRTVRCYQTILSITLDNLIRRFTDIAYSRDSVLYNVPLGVMSKNSMAHHPDLRKTSVYVQTELTLVVVEADL